MTFINDLLQEMFTTYRKRTIVGITVQMFAQLNGINIISFYLPSTLAAAGFNNRKSLLYTGANAIPYVAATMVTWYLADRWGRRPLLILGGCLMAVLLSIVCAFNQANMPISECQWPIRLRHALQHHLWFHMGSDALAPARRNLPAPKS